MLGSKGYKRGDHVIYRMPKQTTHPGQRAEKVYASRHGDTYSYYVTKFWTVLSVPNQETVEVLTPGGKTRRIRASDPLLHKASLWEAIWLRFRWKKNFPELST